MASCSPVKSEFNLDCSICCMRFKKPKFLDCLHCFCFQCIQELRSYQDSGSTKISCPVCREETTLKENNVANLPNNISLSALMEEVTLQEQLLEDEESEFMCQACEEENQATSRCMDCDYCICQECQNEHKRWPAMKSHKIYTLAQLRSQEIAYKSKLREYIPKCHKHLDHNLSVYCNTCEQLLCTICAVVDHEKPKHDLLDLEVASHKCKQDVEKLVAKVEKNKNEIHNAIKEIEESHKQLKSEFKTKNEKISAKADDEVAKLTQEMIRIREEEKKLKQKEHNIYIKKINTFQQKKFRKSKAVDEVDDKLKEVNQLLKQASCFEILDLRRKLLNNLEVLTTKEKQPQVERKEYNSHLFDKLEDDDKAQKLPLNNPNPHQFVPHHGDKIEAEVKIPKKRRPCPKGDWDIKNELATEFAFDVAVNTTNRIIVTDIGERKFYTAFLSSKESPTALASLQIAGLRNVTHVSVNTKDQIIILDNYTVVKTFEKSVRQNYQLLETFTTGQVTTSKPSCLASDDNNQIAVGYWGKDLVAIHNPDGSLIQTLPAPLIDEFMTIYKQHLIYSNYDLKKLQSVDYDGQMNFSVDITSDLPAPWGPRGVCCDTDGSIYVAVWTQSSGKGEIQHFSPDGKFIGCAIRQCEGPYGITITPDGELVVAAQKAVKIYHRVVYM